MQEYRKKMEEQKRLREKLLREKENRRKMAAIEKQNEDAKTDSGIVAGKLYYHFYNYHTIITVYILCFLFVIDYNDTTEIFQQMRIRSKKRSLYRR